MPDVILPTTPTARRTDIAKPSGAWMEPMVVPAGSTVARELGRRWRAHGLRVTPEVLEVIAGYAMRHDGAKQLDLRRVRAGSTVWVPTPESVKDPERWQKQVEAFATPAGREAYQADVAGRSAVAPPKPELHLGPGQAKMALEQPEKVDAHPEQKWMWDRRTVPALLARDVRNAGLPAGLLLVPAEGLPKEELARLETVRPSREALQALAAQRRQAVAELRKLARRTPKSVAGKLAGVLERQPEPKSLLEAKTLLDILNRLRELPRLALARQPVRQLVDHRSDAPITEAYVSMEHDGEYMLGFDGTGLPYEPSGYRLYWCSNDPSSAPCDVVKSEEYPPTLPDARDGRRYLHLAEQDSVLDPAAQYHVYATAYNAHGESVPSNTLVGSFRAAQRGDLNRNGRFDSEDINLMMAELLDGTNPLVLADIDKDGVVTQTDLDRLLELVAQAPPAP